MTEKQIARMWLVFVFVVSTAVFGAFGLWWVPLVIVVGFVSLLITFFALASLVEY